MNYCKACPLVVLCVSRGPSCKYRTAFHITGVYLYECVGCRRIAPRFFPYSDHKDLRFTEMIVPKECKIVTYATTCEECHKESK